jgi:hypothetical protein
MNRHRLTWPVDSLPMRLLLSLGMVVGLCGTGSFATWTLAAWTNPAAVSGATLGAARVDLKVQNLDTYSSFTALGTSKMGPSATSAGVMTVRNNGTVPLTYYVTSAATNNDGKGLGAALDVKVTGASTTTGSYPNETCGGSALADSATSFTTPFVGSAASPRTLAAGAQETLCVQAGLSPTAAASLQNATTNITFGLAAATSPATSWSDSVAVSGTTISTPAVTTPTISCGGQNKNFSNVKWTDTNATSYEIHYGTGSSLTGTATGTPYGITMPGSGTVYIVAIYGNTTWMSGPSNSLTYSGDGANSATCS